MRDSKNAPLFFLEIVSLFIFQNESQFFYFLILSHVWKQERIIILYFLRYKIFELSFQILHRFFHKNDVIIEDLYVVFFKERILDVSRTSKGRIKGNDRVLLYLWRVI